MPKRLLLAVCVAVLCAASLLIGVPAPLSAQVGVMRGAFNGVLTGNLSFGGTTSAFPALARSATQIQAVLADGSAFTSVKAASFISTNNNVVVSDTDVTLPRAVFASGTEPACAVGTRGTMVHVYGGATVKDTVRICAKDAADVYAYRTIY